MYFASLVLIYCSSHWEITVFGKTAFYILLLLYFICLFVYPTLRAVKKCLLTLFLLLFLVTSISSLKNKHVNFKKKKKLQQTSKMESFTTIVNV